MNIRNVLEKMIAARASDLHLKAGTPPVVRVDGVLYTLDEPAPTSQELREVYQQMLNEEQRAHFTTHHEIDFAFGVSGLARFRANIFMQRGTPALALRHVPVEVPTIEDLGLPPAVRDLAFSPRGLVLVTGRTGSGKSTTLAAMIDTINRTTTRNVITVEDPIEFLHRDRLSFIHQREVGLDTASFQDGLRYVLRQDPDIILVGEIRNLETMSTALMAADTGHLVMSTLHTTDVVQSIQRVISFYPPHQHDEIRQSLAANLRAVVSQRLIARRDGAGRIPAVEVMVTTPTVREYILEPEKIPLLHSLIGEGVTQYGMQTFDQSVLALLREGLITEEEALRNCNNPNELTLKLKGFASTSDRTWQAVDATNPESGAGPIASTPSGSMSASSSASGSGPKPDWMSRD
jgi:twitching motility protein PilT